MSQYSEVLHIENAAITLDDRTILSDMRLTINTAEFCYVQGDTGAGKTSLIKGLFGLLPMTGARIYAAGHDLSELTEQTLPEYRRKVGLISDDYPLFQDQTVFKNLDRVLAAIRWDSAAERERRINEVLDQMGISILQGEQIKDLPSGLKQKIKIARAIVHKPKLILADDPMVHLDSRSVDEIMGLFIQVIKQDKTSVLCTLSNDQLLRAYPARTYLCADGTVTESKVSYTNLGC